MKQTKLLWITVMSVIFVSCYSRPINYGGRSMAAVNKSKYRVDYGYKDNGALVFLVFQEARTNWPTSSELQIRIDDRTGIRTYEGWIQFPGKPRQNWSILRGGYEISDTKPLVRAFKLDISEHQLEIFLNSDPSEYTFASLEAFLQRTNQMHK